MLFRNRFVLLLALAALLAFVSLSLQFFHLIPVLATKNGVTSKNRKRIMPDPATEPPVMDPVYEALLYCNIPGVAERSMEDRKSDWKTIQNRMTGWGSGLRTSRSHITLNWRLL